MQEAAVSISATSLCSLLAMILTWLEPSNPLDIYDYYKESMAEDFLHQQRTRLGNADLSFYDDMLALNDLQDKVLFIPGPLMPASFIYLFIIYCVEAQKEHKHTDNYT